MSHYDDSKVLVRTVAVVGHLKQPTKQLESKQCIWYINQIATSVGSYVRCAGK